MTGQEIRAEINNYYKQQEQFMADGFSTFVLHAAMLDINSQIKKLQDSCEHVDNGTGHCIYCDKELKND